MLSPSLRFDIRNNQQFFAQAKSLNSQFLRLLYQKNEQDDKPSLRLAIIVPKRHGKAVVRVKTKRLLRAAINELQKQLPSVFALPYVVAIYVKGSPQDFSQYFSQLTKLLNELLNKVEG